MVGEKEFVEAGQVGPSERLFAQFQPCGPNGLDGQAAFDACESGGRQDGAAGDGQQRCVVGRAENPRAVTAHGDFRPGPFGQPAGQLRRGLTRGGRSLGERQVVVHGHGFGLKAPEGVAVVERHPCRRQALFAVGVQFNAHESRYACRITFRGGQRLDARCEPFRGGGVGVSEQFARRGVEHGDVSGDVARATPGEVHGLV